MKRLLVGGAYQGKLAYGLDRWNIPAEQASDGGSDPPEIALAAPVLNRLHLLVERLLAQGRDPEAEILAALDHRDSWLVICDEVGCGVVPVEPDQRRWREAVGRICQILAARADVVERVQCGLPVRLK